MTAEIARVPTRRRRTSCASCSTSSPQLLGSTESKLVLAQNRTPNVIMLVGLQGSGKTTASAKLAYLLKSQGHSPLLAACDTHRPAAADQLETLGGEIGVRGLPR